MVSRVSRYLKLVRQLSSPDLEARVAALDEQRRRLDEQLEAHPEYAPQAMAHLARKRLLASNTLRCANLDARRAWGDANRWLDDLLLREPVPTWSLDELKRLNAILTGTDGALRETPIFGAGEEFLSPSEIGGELAALEEHVTSTRRHTLLVATTMYIAVVTIHPFANGNGRTARLAADRILLGSGYLPVCFLSSITTHVAQTQAGRERSPAGSMLRVLAAVAESYATVQTQIDRARDVTRSVAGDRIEG